LQIIPVLDNFHISTDHIPEDQKEGGWVVGIMHIQKQLENVLAENGVEEIETKIGDKFNPEIHEAIQNSGKEQETSDKIQKIVMKGYKMSGKIIRPVKVIVG
jgi:molecular chaperone GrpE